MNLDRYLQVSNEIEQREKEVEERKRHSYTVGDVDVLKNFKRDAELAGITPMQNWLTHFLKQVAAVVTYVRHPDVAPSESLVSRVGDIRTYAKLLVALAEDAGRDTGLQSRYLKKVFHYDPAPGDDILQRYGFAGIREKGD